MAQAVDGAPAGPLRGRSFLVSPAGAALVLLLVAVAARWFALGNPIVQIDEQFYLMVGRRMWDGAIPFVDIFDRKPVGLFLIYAVAQAGGGMVAAQLLALLCGWATALAVAHMARRVAPPGAALAAAALYLLWLDLAGGEAGQAPVFYNLPVAVAAAILLRPIPRAAERRGDLRSPGTGAMLLAGLAMQIKYSVVFEGLYFGLVLIAAARAGGRRTPALLTDVSLWVGAAVLPTAAAAGAYAAIGHWPEWRFANLTSILARGSEAPATVEMRMLVLAMLLVPLLLALPLRRWLDARPENPPARAELRFLDGWAAAALLGVVLFGTWFNHYALPLFAPLAVVAAPLGARSWGRAYLALLLGCGAVQGQRILHHHAHTRGDGTVLAAATRAAGRFDGCAFVYDGLPAFYDSTRSCLPTTRPFPAHLQSLNERGATGIDEAAEVARIMSHRPERVMTMEPAYDEENLAARAALYRVIRRGYVELYRYAGGTHQLVLYGRADTLARSPAPRLTPAAAVPDRGAAPHAPR